MLNRLVRSALESRFNARIVGVEPLNGGSINLAFHLTLTPHRELLLKLGTPQSFEQYLAESEGLKRLASVAGVKTPAVLALEPKPVPHLVLEYLTPGDCDDTAVGSMIASLHRETAPLFGLDHDNFIGSNRQQNGWVGSWSEFFWECRLTPQLELAVHNGWGNGGFSQELRSKELAIRETIEAHRPMPSLCHGDLWSGNVLNTTLGPALIDPAIYFGDRETDLAFLSLFGGLSPEIWESYQRAMPVAEGFERRREIYNLYHVMNHANLFGGHYIVNAMSLIRRW